MELARYAVTDAYTLEEMRREYQNSDAKGRIAMLDKLYGDDNLPPYEIAVLAVGDDHVEVRQWVARRGRSLTYRTDRDLREQPTDKQSEYDLVDRLKKDPDPFVRACLRENPNVFGGLNSFEWKSYFQEATHLERLALVRNPRVDTGLIEKIFDPEDEELVTDIERRTELVFAFLTNPVALARTWDVADLDSEEAQSWFTWGAAYSFLRKLWELSLKWPNETGVPYLVYRCVPTHDEIKAQIYQKCEEPALRRIILETNNDWKGPETIKLGMKDTDEWCRYWAYRKVRYFEPEDLEAILTREHSATALTGLARNESLRLAELEKVRARLLDLKDETGSKAASDTIEHIQKETRKRQLLRDPEKLFAEEARDGKFLEEKIDFIGKKLISFEQDVTGKLLAIQRELSVTIKVLAILMIIGIAVFLLRWLVR